MSVVVYVDTPKWTFRSHSTDTAYIRSIFPTIEKHYGRLAISRQTSNISALSDNVQWLRTAAEKRLLRSRYARSWTRRISLRDPALKMSDLVYSNGDYPINSPLPVVWQNTLLDPRMRRARGDSTDYIDYESSRKRNLFQKAGAVIVSTDSERDRLCDLTGVEPQKIHSIPFYLPDVFSTAEDVTLKHDASERVNILFVGNQAKLKRLELLVNALELLPHEMKSRIDLTVVSKFTDGEVPVRGNFRIRILGGVSHARVQEEMRRAHILVNPSSYESFGFVFIEALAAGAVAVGPSWEAQQEIMDAGRCGVLLPEGVDAVGLRSAVAQLIDSDSLRKSIAQAAHERFHTRYSWEVVGPRLVDVAHGVVHGP